MRYHFYYSCLLFLLLQACSNGVSEHALRLKRMYGAAGLAGIADSMSAWPESAGLGKSIKIQDGRNKMEYLSNLVDSIYYVKLETKKECLIGEIDKIYHAAGKIIIFDKRIANAVFVFTGTGKFITKIGDHGDGPGEFTKLQDITVNAEDSSICLLDMGKRKMFTYSMEGKYLNDYPVSIFISAFEHSHNDQFILGGEEVANSHVPAIENLNLFMFSFKKRKVASAAFPFTYRPDFSLSTDRQLFRFNNEIYYNPRFNDTIYSITNKTINPAFVLDFGPNGFTEKEKQANTNDPINHRIAGDKNAFYLNGGFFSTDDICFFEIFNIESKFACIYNRHNGSTNFFSGINVDRPDAILFNFPKGICNRFFISSLPAYQMVNYKEYLEKNKQLNGYVKELYKRTRADDNPVLIYYRFK